MACTEKMMKKFKFDADGNMVNGPYMRNGKPKGRPQVSRRAARDADGNILKDVNGNKITERDLFEEKVYSNQERRKGKIIDPNTREPLDWKPGDSRKEKVDFGHKTGKSYKEQFGKYQSAKTKDEACDALRELKKFQSNPNNFQLEAIGSNRGNMFT